MNITCRLFRLTKETKVFKKGQKVWHVSILHNIFYKKCVWNFKLWNRLQAIEVMGRVKGKNKWVTAVIRLESAKGGANCYEVPCLPQPTGYLLDYFKTLCYNKTREMGYTVKMLKETNGLERIFEAEEKLEKAKNKLAQVKIDIGAEYLHDHYANLKANDFRRLLKERNKRNTNK